ncbi:MAG: hypothetical protein ACI9VL_000938 [Colwellia sp.]
MIKVAMAIGKLHHCLQHSLISSNYLGPIRNFENDVDS